MMSNNGNGNETQKPCESCKELFMPNKYTPHQKYCNNCRESKYKEPKAEWRHKNGKEYMKNYMKTYRRIKPLAAILFIFILSGLTKSAHAETWLDYKKASGFEDYSGNIGLSGTYLKPPDFELNLKFRDSYITLNRISFRKRGWMPRSDSEDEQGFIYSEPKEAGSYALEYGRTGTTNETSLLEGDSVYGWKLSLGQVSEILWGRGSYGDRIASASFNTDKFAFFVTKSYGTSEEDQDYSFITSDFNTDMSNNFPKASAQPRTKYEGGDLYIPLQWRDVQGNFEIAARKFFDQETNEDKKGIAFALNAAAPRFIFTFRNVSEGFESETRTTDVSVKGIFYKTDNTNVSAGYRLLDFSSKTVDTRHGFVAGLQQKILKFSVNLEGELYRQGLQTSTQVTGGINGSLYNTTLSLRRSENITGFSTSNNNSLSIARKEGSISLSYGTSEYQTNKAENMQGNMYVNLSDECKIGAGIGYSTSENATTITKTARTNYTAAFRNTTFNANLSPTSESYTIARNINLNRYRMGTSMALGVTYQRFIGGDGVTGNLTYAW